jgi:hypothetical protein
MAASNLKFGDYGTDPLPLECRLLQAFEDLQLMVNR